MLYELHIENLAVIENATIRFGEHFNVFTGETGAGKSILIGGINAILGQRVYKDIIREGTDKAYVSAVFTDCPESVSEKLNEFGLNCDNELIISREINSDGRSTARINSRPVTISALHEIGDLLVNIHGQHDSQNLLDQTKHLGILDSYARSDDLLSSYQKSFRELQATAKELNRLKSEKNQNTKREEYLAEIIEDIGSLEITIGEDEKIEERFRLLDNAVSLKNALSVATACLSETESDNSAGDLISQAYSELEANQDILPVLKPLNERLSAIGIELEDIATELIKLRDSLEIDDSEYSSLTQRRNDLKRIKRRYGTSLDEVIKVYEDALQESQGLASFDDKIAELEARKSQLLIEVTRKAEVLSEHREKASERFSRQVADELSFLNMPYVKLEVRKTKGKLTLSGMDSIEFLISANKGESPKPLAKIASGGELSRIMLALKTVLADRDAIPTLIFDEIDSGVSGRAAQKIGIKLREISGKHQVICVTHLAQIAIMADDHMLIEKHESGDRTVTDVTHLDFDKRKYEIARILGGDNITETVLKDAEEQLINATKGE
ncbi:MAG: DNA repair protein RecN [Oscillospiraceae bacterium]|nr:DNA repair protein RecN [Oscillospiraceae bacterium]